jgi:hypothetical protein
VPAESVHKLCGDHHEHMYSALRISTPFVQSMSLAWGTENDLLITLTSTNCIGARRRGWGVSGAVKGTTIQHSHSVRMASS